MNKNPIVSIIVPCKEIDEYIKECIEYCRRLDYEDYKIILLPDNSNENLEKVEIVAEGI